MSLPDQAAANASLGSIIGRLGQDHDGAVVHHSQRRSIRRHLMKSCDDDERLQGTGKKALIVRSFGLRTTRLRHVRSNIRTGQTISRRRQQTNCRLTIDTKSSG